METVDADLEEASESLKKEGLRMYTLKKATLEFMERHP